LAQLSVQPHADEWRQTFAEPQVPYAKIMGCAQSLVHAGSLALIKQLGRDKPASNSPLIISYQYTAYTQATRTVTAGP